MFDQGKGEEKQDLVGLNSLCRRESADEEHS